MANTNNNEESLKEIDTELIFEKNLFLIKEILKSKFQNNQNFQYLLENLEKDFEKINEKKYEDGKDYSKKDKNNEYIKILDKFLKKIYKEHKDLSLNLTSVINRINNFEEITAQDLKENFFNKKNIDINFNNVEYFKVIAVIEWNLESFLKVLDDKNTKQTIEKYIEEVKEELKGIKTIANIDLNENSDSGFSDNESDSEKNPIIEEIDPNSIKEPQEPFITKKFINENLKRINKIEYSLNNIINNFNKVSEEKIEKIDQPGILKNSLNVIKSTFSVIQHPLNSLKSLFDYDPYENNPANIDEIYDLLGKAEKIADILSSIENFFEIQYTANKNIENDKLKDLIEDIEDFLLYIETTLDNGNLEKKISLLSEIQDSLSEISKYCNIEFKSSYKTYEEQISEFESFCNKVSSSFLETNTEFITQIEKLNENELTENSRYLKNQFYLLEITFNAITEIFNKIKNRKNIPQKETIENLESLKSNIKNNGFDLKNILEKFYESKTKVIQKKIIKKFEEIITQIQNNENHPFLNLINENFKKSIESNEISKIKNARINFIHYCENHNIFHLIQNIHKEFLKIDNGNQNYLEELENTLDFFEESEKIFKRNKEENTAISAQDNNTYLLNQIKSQILEIPGILFKNFNPNHLHLNEKVDEILKKLFFSSYKYPTKQENAIKNYKKALGDLSKLVNDYIIAPYNEIIENYNNSIDKVKNINEEKKETIEYSNFELLLTQDNPNYNFLLKDISVKLNEFIKDNVKLTLDIIKTEKEIDQNTPTDSLINDDNKITSNENINSSTLSSDKKTEIIKSSIINLDLYNLKTIKISYTLLSISLIILAVQYYFLSYAMLNIPFTSTIATIAGICLGIVISQKLFHKILINKKIFHNDALDDKKEERALLNNIKPLIFEKIQPKNEILKKRFDNWKLSVYKIVINLILCQILTIVLSLNILPLCDFIESQNIPEFIKSSLEFLKFVLQEIIKFIFDFFENKLGIDFTNKDNFIIVTPILLISIALLELSLIILNNFFNSEKDKGAILDSKNESLKNLNYDDKYFKIISLNEITFTEKEINEINQ